MKLGDVCCAAALFFGAAAFVAVSDNGAWRGHTDNSIMLVSNGEKIALDDVLAIGGIGVVLIDDTPPPITQLAVNTRDTSTGRQNANSPSAAATSAPTTTPPASITSSAPTISSDPTTSSAPPPTTPSDTTTPSAPTPSVPTTPTTPTASAPATSAPRRGCVNINTADERGLTTLRGVGPVIAAAIVAYREEHGRFNQLEEIQRVRGIGAARFAQIREDICL